MERPPAHTFFNHEAARSYDERNRSLAPIADNLHFLIGLLLSELPTHARILCVGVGTGAEILPLAQRHPHWTFVGVDPSQSMLDVCAQRLKDAGAQDRCELRCGFAKDAPPGRSFDAALSIYVAHFVPTDERADFFQQMTSRLKNGGHLVNAEISGDLNADDASTVIHSWGKVQQLMGATPESIANLPHVLRNMLSVLAPSETEALLRASGIAMPVRFFQSLMITGWHGQAHMQE
jgi:tRNA (cmo5U34)-methyltransferase